MFSAFTVTSKNSYDSVHDLHNSCSESHHHFIGQADVISLTGDFISVKPLSHRKFFMIDGERIVSIYVAEKSEQKRAAERPGLAFVVTEIFDFQTYFLHDLSMYCLFNGFPDFRKTGNERIIFKASSFIF